MKIAVLNCPHGATGEGIVKAFLDAGLPRAALQRELKKRSADKPSKALVGRMLKALERAGICLSDRPALMTLAQAAVAIQYFKIKKCFVRNLAIGRKGNPRTMKLLGGFLLERVPVDGELVTPEAAAILTVLCEREMSIPATRPEFVGFGTNGILVSIGETVAPFRRERILLLETNIDDMNPQGFELLYERLFEAGALDVWVESILMKKMRPAFKLSVLMMHPLVDKISEVIFKETPSLGVRFLELDRFSLPRKTIRVKTRLGPVRYKVGWLDSKHSAAHPEYEDLKRIALKRNLSFREVRVKMAPRLR